MKKRICCLLLAIVLVVGLMPVISLPASASLTESNGYACYFAGETVAFMDIDPGFFLQAGVNITGRNS